MLSTFTSFPGENGKKKEFSTSFPGIPGAVRTLIK
jgi:hypothetical protein